MTAVRVASDSQPTQVLSSRDRVGQWCVGPRPTGQDVSFNDQPTAKLSFLQQRNDAREIYASLT